MAGFTQQLSRTARLSSRAARLTVCEPRAALLALRMASWVVSLSALVKLLPLPRVLSILSTRTRARQTRDAPETQARLARLLDSLLGANFWVFTPTCWKRAAVLHRYLALEGIETRVVFGLRREGEDALSGHAWLEAGGEPLLEATPPDYRITFSFP
jgi:hypothetical protein